MPKPFLIIDGYNLMHAAGMARGRYGPGDLYRCRLRFLKFVIGRLHPQERERTTIVFDATGVPPDLPRQTIFQGVQLMFNREGSDADTLIEELIADHSAPRQIRLISSDHRLQKAARKRKSMFVDSEVFVEELERREPFDESQPIKEPRTADPKFSGEVSSEETEEWMKVFGDFPETKDVPRKKVDHQAVIPATSDELQRLQAEIDEIAAGIDDEPTDPRRQTRRSR